MAGDIDVETEQRLAWQKLIKGPEDILKVSHHGSKNGTSSELLKLINPQIALIGVGKDNKYNHPADVVINLLNDLGVKVFRTDEDGDIGIQFGKNLIIEN